jgi:uncharacterized paraquat-inducible protein A
VATPRADQRWQQNGDSGMLTILIMVLLIVGAGWLDSRLNWQQADQRNQGEERL